MCMNVGEKMFSGRGYQCGVSCNLPFGMLCARLILSAGLSGFGYTAHAETLAGTRIANTASITYSAAGSPAAALSNTDTIIVAERLDVALVRSSAPLPPSTAAIDVLLTNSGNGQEAFALSARFATVSDVVSNSIGALIGALVAIALRAAIYQRDEKMLARRVWELGLTR